MRVMKDKTLTKKEIEFCRIFCATNNSREAAAAAGYRFPALSGLKLLDSERIQNEIKRRKTKKIKTDEVVTGLKRIAFGSVADAVRLLLDDEDAKSKIDNLDLFLISEIKTNSKGGLEIKFFDRIKAMEKLLEVSDAADSDKDNSFLDAILKGSEMLNQKGDNDNEL